MSYNPRIEELERKVSDVENILSHGDDLRHTQKVVTSRTAVSGFDTESIAKTTPWLVAMRNDYTKGKAEGYTDAEIAAKIVHRLKMNSMLCPSAQFDINTHTISISLIGVIPLVVSSTLTSVAVNKAISVDLTATAATSIAAAYCKNSSTNATVTNANISYTYNSGKDMLYVSYEPMYS